MGVERFSPSLAPEWTQWIEENRRRGIGDRDIIDVLVGRGIAPQVARGELAKVAASEDEPSYKTVNRAAWNAIADAYDHVAGDAAQERGFHARALLDDPVPLPWSEVRTVLCLAAGGGEQSILFASLGLSVVVVDLSPAQLERDREAAAALGLEVQCVESDMLDLSALYGWNFDLVYQPLSACYVPDVGRVHREVAAVLRRGGWYAVEHWNPLHMQVAGLGRPDLNLDGYSIVRPQRSELVVRFDDDGEDLPDRSPVSLCWHYIHPLDALLGTLCDAGFAIEMLAERYLGDPHAELGTPAHLAAAVPPLFTVLAQRVVSRE